MLIEEPLFLIFITVGAYVLARKLYAKKHIVIFNPLILAPAAIITLIKISGIDFNIYKKTNEVITFFLGPATVALGVPLYKQVPLIKKNLITILTGITIGAFTGLISGVLITKALGASAKTLYSIAAKSVTMPIAIGITEKIGGLENLIVFGVMIAGIFGGAAGPEILRLARVKSKIAMGLGIGTASHAGGTSRAVQLGETEGSMSGAAIVLTGLVTAIITPLLIKFLV